MNRGILVAALCGALLAFPVDGAFAGGSWLETERTAYAVDDHAVARGAFGRGQLEGTISDGPYYAYLVPGTRWFKTPGPIPAYAIPLGPIAITGGNTYLWVARIEFRVPDVPTGRYSIQYCNDPCTVDGVGDLMGGSLFIGATVDEARLGGRVERLGHRIDRLQRQRDKWSDRATELERDLLRAEERVPHVSAAVREAVPTSPGAPRPLVSAWAALSVAIGMAILAAAILSRRRRRSAIPDTLPPELVDEVSLQVPLRQPATSGGRPPIVSASPGRSSLPGSPVTKS